MNNPNIDVNDGNAIEVWSNLICQPRHERTRRDITQMSVHERTEVFSDLGGTQQINPENPNFVSRSLEELDIAISQIPTNQDKSAFTMAQCQSPKYIESLRLKFLRADNFDIPRSASRMVRHFQEKLELFGPTQLNADITLNNLSHDDMESLQSGGVQFLPHHDQFGRLVLCSRQVDWKYKHRDNMVRTTPFVFFELLRYVQRYSISYSSIFSLPTTKKSRSFLTSCLCYYDFVGTLLIFLHIHN